MVDLYKEIDFNRKDEDQNNRDVEYELFLKQAAREIAKEQADQLKKIKKPEFDEELQNHLIVAGIPVLKLEAKQKFLKVFISYIDKKKIGPANGMLSIDVGFQNQIGNQTLYIIYKSSAQCKVAFKKLNNLKFDKQHTLTCFTIKQIHQVMKFNPQYHEPKLFPTEQTIAYNFVEEKMNQFVVRQGNDLAIRWLDHIDKNTKSFLQNQYLKIDINVRKVGFSPRGRYMALCVDKGTYLYAGKDMKLKGFYPQQAPIDFKFSSNQKYMITFNGNDLKNKQNFIIWGVQEEIKLKSYRSYAGQNLDSFQFNQKSSLLAVCTINQVFFYNLEQISQFRMQLKLAQQEINSLKVSHIQKVSWLLDNKSLVCVCYQTDYNPISVAVTRVFIYDTEKKTQRKWRTWTQHAKKGQIIVSQKGDWVAVIMKKFLKKGHFSTVIQIANLLKHDDPIEISSIEIKDVVGNVAWDFHGNRIAIIHEDQDTRKGINVKHVVQFHQIAVKGKKLDLVKIQQVKNILSNRVLLSSCGTFFAVFNISETSPQRGKISFGLFVKDKADKRKTVIQWIKQNLMIHQLNYFKGDPSGRFILLGTEKSYQIWNMAGEMLFKDTLLKPVNDLQWRPRALAKLSLEQQEKIAQEEKEIRKKYQELDVKKLDFLKYQKEQAKKLRKIQFADYLGKKRSFISKFTQKRKKTIGFDQVLTRTGTYQVVTDIQIA